MTDLDRRLREVSQLRKIWRDFREPQERAEDERRAAPLLRDFLASEMPHDPGAHYGRSLLLAAVRHWWRYQEYSSILKLAAHLSPDDILEEPLTWAFIAAAREQTGASPPETRND
jgi:hypothetical protein